MTKNKRKEVVYTMVLTATLITNLFNIPTDIRASKSSIVS